MHARQTGEAGQCGRGQVFGVKGLVAIFVGNAGRLDVFEIVLAVVHQVRGHHVLQRGEHGLGATGVLLLPVAQHVANLHALQVGLAAAERARNDGELAVRGPADQVLLGHIGQRADDHELAVVAGELGRHTFELATEKHVQKEGLQHVVAVVTQREFVALELARHVVQNAPAQAAAQAAHGFAFGDVPLDDGVGVLRLDVELHTQLGQVLGQDVVGEAGLLLIEVDRHDLEVDGRALLHLEQDVEHAVAVFATGHADHDAVTLFDHVEVHDRLAHLAAQALFQLVGFALDLELFVALGGGFCSGRVGGGVFFNPGSVHVFFLVACWHGGVAYCLGQFSLQTLSFAINNLRDVEPY